MMDHLRTHSGNKPFICPMCNKSFKQRAQLYKHMTIHEIDIINKPDGDDVSHFVFKV